MGESEIRAGKAYIEIAAKDKGFHEKMKRINERIREVGKTVAEIGGSEALFAAAKEATDKLSSIGTIGGVVTEAFHKCLDVWVEGNSALQEMSERTGIAASKLGEYQHAAEMGGSTITDWEIGLKKLQAAIESAAEGAADARTEFQRLGMSWQEMRAMSPDKQFDLLAKKLAGLPSATDRTAEAMKFLGRDAPSLLPMIKELEGYKREARELGLAPTDAEAKMANQLEKSQIRLSRVVTGAWQKIGGIVAEPFERGYKIITQFVAEATKWMAANAGIVKGVAIAGIGMSVLGAAMTGAGLGIVAMTTAAGGFATVLGLLGSLFAPVPIAMAAITAALGAGGYAFFKYTETGKAAASAIGKIFGRVKGTIQTAMGGIFDAIAGGNLAMAGKMAMLGVRAAFADGMAALAESVGGDFGDMLGKLGEQLSDGDWSGAWETVVKNSAAIWHGFCETIANAFTKTMRFVLDKLQFAQKKVSEFFLQDAEDGDPLAMWITGHSPEEAERAEKTRRRSVRGDHAARRGKRRSFSPGRRFPR